MWRGIVSFSSGSVCCVLAFERYDERDYYRDYSAFMHDAVAEKRE